MGTNSPHRYNVQYLCVPQQVTEFLLIDSKEAQSLSPTTSHPVQMQHPSRQHNAAQSWNLFFILGHTDHNYFRMVAPTLQKKGPLKPFSCAGNGKLLLVSVSANIHPIPLHLYVWSQRKIQCRCAHLSPEKKPAISVIAKKSSHECQNLEHM